MSGRTGRYLGALIGLMGGGVLLSATLVLMNRPVEKPKEVKSRDIKAFDAKKKQKKQKKKVAKKPKPKPKRTSRSRAPRPVMAADLGGLGAGLALFNAGDLSDAGNDLLGGGEMAKDMVMNEAAVDQPPKQVDGRTPEYPRRAQAKAIEGYVVLRILVGSDGSVRKVSVLESTPEGVFEDAALQAARTWRFEPALYQGQPVSLTVTRRLTFKLS